MRQCHGVDRCLAELPGSLLPGSTAGRIIFSMIKACPPLSHNFKEAMMVIVTQSVVNMVLIVNLHTTIALARDFLPAFTYDGLAAAISAHIA